jgi:hypothetical protein
MLLIACLVLSACERKAAPPLPRLPTVALADIPAPAVALVELQRGSNLRAIADTSYGHERFSGFVAAFNNIHDPERVMAGTAVKTPSLAVAFREAGLDAAYQPMINVLAKACTDYYAAEPAYLAARRSSGVREGKFGIPAEIQSTLMASADAIDAAVAHLRAVQSPHAVPKMAVGQFTQASSQIRELAAGHIDGYGYDDDLVGQRFGLGFTNALIWVQQGHR